MAVDTHECASLGSAYTVVLSLLKALYQHIADKIETVTFSDFFVFF